MSAVFGIPAERLVPWAALLPVPVWFLFSVLFTASPAWRAQYRPAEGQPVVADIFEREMSHLWSGKYFAEVPGELEPKAFVAEFEACVVQERAAEVPFMLVADGTARFLLNGAQQLSTNPEPGSGRQVSGKVISLTPGAHLLRVEFTAHRRPSVGLLASFDGAAPRAVSSGKIVAGTKVTRPKPGPEPCGD